jgi:hypothetical protein
MVGPPWTLAQDVTKCPRQPANHDGLSRLSYVACFEATFNSSLRAQPQGGRTRSRTTHRPAVVINERVAVSDYLRAQRSTLPRYG